MQALDASLYLDKGNVELKKTVKRRGESSYYIVSLMVLAALMLLFVDWISSR